MQGSDSTLKIANRCNQRKRKPSNITATCGGYVIHDGFRCAAHTQTYLFPSAFPFIIRLLKHHQAPDFSGTQVALSPTGCSNRTPEPTI